MNNEVNTVEKIQKLIELVEALDEAQVEETFKADVRRGGAWELISHWSKQLPNFRK